jgi:hypothetical protein
VTASGAAAISDVNNASDLCQGEPGGLSGANESEPGQGGVFIDAIAVLRCHSRTVRSCLRPARTEVKTIPDE